jgi:HSP20 family protein
MANTSATRERSSSQDVWSGRGYITPPANITATDNGYLIEIEMPGVNKEGLEITVESNELTITGRRHSELPDGELLYCESALADFRRIFELGLDIDTSKISAEMAQGIVKLRLPKAEQAKPRKIQIAG